MAADFNEIKAYAARSAPGVGAADGTAVLVDGGGAAYHPFRRQLVVAKKMSVIDSARFHALYAVALDRRLYRGVRRQVSLRFLASDHRDPHGDMNAIRPPRSRRPGSDRQHADASGISLRALIQSGAAAAVIESISVRRDPRSFGDQHDAPASPALDQSRRAVRRDCERPHLAGFHTASRPRRDRYGPSHRVIRREDVMQPQLQPAHADSASAGSQMRAGRIRESGTETWSIDLLFETTRRMSTLTGRRGAPKRAGIPLVDVGIETESQAR